MIYLLLILLLFGFIQSLLELRKEEEIKPHWRVKKILSLLYIGGFAIGIMIIVIQQKETNKVNKLIEGISTSSTKIDTIDKKLMQVLEVKDSLLTQYEKVNERLSKQIDLNLKSFKEKAPIIDLLDTDIHWKGNDTTLNRLELCIRNIGKRNATIIGGHGYILFFDNENKPFFSVDIPGNHNNDLLEPHELEQMMLCYYSWGVNEYSSLTANLNFSIIYLEITYRDVLLNTEKVGYFYKKGTNTNPIEFGGPRDWQIKLAQEWARENNK